MQIKSASVQFYSSLVQSFNSFFGHSLSIRRALIPFGKVSKCLTIRSSIDEVHLQLCQKMMISSKDETKGDREQEEDLSKL